MGWALTRLDAAALEEGARDLASGDIRLGRLLESNGFPPLWERATGFASLTKIILEQQVSLDSAAAAFGNLKAAVDKVAPDQFLELDDSQLRTIGFSRQKAGYCRGLARGLCDGSIELDHLDGLDDESARRYLMEIRGIGPWTADVYLLFALRRPDVWPTGDRALVVSMMENLELPSIPTYEAAERTARQWQPWRSVAARMLWHGYLLERGRSLE